MTTEELNAALKKQGKEITPVSTYTPPVSDGGVFGSLAEQNKKPTLLDKLGGASKTFLQGMQDFGVGMVKQTAKAAIQLPRTALGSIAELAGQKDLAKSMKEPINVPLVGDVRGISAVPSDVKNYNTETPGEMTGQAATQFVEAGMPGVGKIVKTPLTKIAEKLYQSALKPTSEALEKGVVKTALNEKVWLTKGGVERVATKIDDLESQLGTVIEEGKAQGTTIPLKGIEEFIDPIRKFYTTVDPKVSEKASTYIDDTLKAFKETYGENLPIEKAQELKVNTMRFLRNAYGELSSVEKETQKQMARFLKEGIVEKSPVVGEINKRLKSLYELDNSLEKASRRIGNLNLLGISAKLGAAAGGKAGAALGLVGDFMDRAAIKSGAAIGLNELAKLGGKAGSMAKIPVSELLNYIHTHYGMDKPINQ